MIYNKAKYNWYRQSIHDQMGVSLRKQENFTIRNSLIESTILTGPKHIIISIVVENFSIQFKHLQFK